MIAQNTQPFAGLGISVVRDRFEDWREVLKLFGVYRHVGETPSVSPPLHLIHDLTHAPNERMWRIERILCADAEERSHLPGDSLSVVGDHGEVDTRLQRERVESISGPVFYPRNLLVGSLQCRVLAGPLVDDPSRETGVDADDVRFLARESGIPPACTG